MDDVAGLLLDQIPDAVVLTSPHGEVIAWNLAAEAIFGYPRSEAIGQPLDILIIPADRRDEEAARLKELREDTPLVYEAVRRRKDGSLLHASITSKAVYTPAGDMLYLLTTQKDVTHLKLMRDVKLVEARFRDLLESTPDAIIIANVTGRIVLVNGQAESVFGYPRGDLVGQPIEMLLPHKDRAAHLGLRGLYAMHPRTRTMGEGRELNGLRRDGTEFPVEISLSPIVTEEGTMIMSAVRDITARKRADQKFRDLLEAAPDAMIIVDRTGEIVLVNSQAVHLFGWQREELLGRHIEMLVPARFRGNHAGHRGGFFGKPRPRSMGAGLDLYGLRRDGSEFPVEISLSPIETEQGILVSSAIRDVTDRKRVERTLQEANRMKSVFLASMSHELRTPLNGIIGFSELLFDEKVGPINTRQKEYLDDILHSGRHLLQLINDVLDLSKVEAGRMELFPERFAVAAAIEEACVLLHPVADAKHITIALTVDADISEVFLDRQKFQQVMLNLLSNAIKFTDEGGRVEVVGEVAFPGMLDVHVSDTGIGIRKEDIEKLFQEFQQLDSGAARRYQGTGLGLSLVRKIVELQGGSVAVTSDFGNGTRFTVRLPIAARSVPIEGAAHSMEGA